MEKLLQINSLDPKNIGFVIFKPDTVAQNLQFPIWGHLKNRGYKILNYKEFYITPEKRKLLYKDFFLNSRTNWEMGEEFYNLGPSIGILVYRSYFENFNSVSNLLSKHEKGNFIPELSEIGSIRGEFNSINPVFNLIHTSDTPEEVQRESAIFFTEDELLKSCIENQTYFEKLLQKNINENFNSHFDFVMLFLNIRLGILTYYSSLISKEILKEYEKFILHYLNKWKNYNARENRKFSLEFLGKEEKFLSNNKDLPNIFGILSNYRYFSSYKFNDLFEELEKINIYLGDWDKYLLKSSMYYILFE